MMTEAQLVEHGVSTLTKRQIEVLRLVASGQSLATEHGNAFIGNRRTSYRTIDPLLRVCAIKIESSERGCEYYKISSIGQQIIRILDYENTQSEGCASSAAAGKG